MMLQIFHDERISNKKKISLIKSMGLALNYEYGSNWTDQVVDELVSILKDRGE